MSKVHATLDAPGGYRKALANLLNRNNYHVVAPTCKNQMIRREFARILNRGKN